MIWAPLVVRRVALIWENYFWSEFFNALQRRINLEPEKNPFP